MPTDATGTPTSLGIRKYNTSVDAPSGLGFNGAMDDIDALLAARVTKSLLTTTGDIIYASGVSTPARLGIGSTGNVLTVAGGVPSWAAPTGGAITLADITLGSANATIDSGVFTSSGYNHLLIYLAAKSTAAVISENAFIDFNADSAANYYYTYLQELNAAVTGANAIGQTKGYIGDVDGASSSGHFGNVKLDIPFASTARTHGWLADAFNVGTGTAATMAQRKSTGQYIAAAAITRVRAQATSTFVAGSRLMVYGIA